MKKEKVKCTGNDVGIETVVTGNGFKNASNHIEALKVTHKVILQLAKDLQGLGFDPSTVKFSIKSK